MGNDLEAVWQHISREKLIELSLALSAIPSVTGEEQAMADYLYRRLSDSGFAPKIQPVEAGRANVIGMLTGDGTGPRLMFNGHLDTPYSGLEPEWPENPPQYPPKPYQDGDWIYGTGINNMKSSLAMYVVVMEAIKAAGVRLKGDVVFAGVAGENGCAQVDRFKGARYRGGGVGTLHLVTHGGVADAVVVGEPTRLKLCLGQLGPVWIRITLRTIPIHSGHTSRDHTAIKQAMKVMDSLEAWGLSFEQRYKLLDRPAAVRIPAFEGGWPWRLSHIPFVANIYLDVRITPEITAMDAVHEVEEVLRKAPIDRDNYSLETEVYQCSPSAVIPLESPLAQAVSNAHESVFGKPPETMIEAWQADSATFMRYGIPALNYSHAGRVREGSSGAYSPLGEHVNIEDLYQCARVYASLALSLCTKTRVEAGLRLAAEPAPVG